MRHEWIRRARDGWRARYLDAERVLKEKAEELAEAHMDVEQLSDHCDVIEAANEALGEECEHLRRELVEATAKLQQSEDK